MTDAFEDAWEFMDPNRGHPAKRYYPDDMESLLDFALDNFRSPKYHAEALQDKRRPSGRSPLEPLPKDQLKPDTKLLFDDWKENRKTLLQDRGKDNRFGRKGSVFVRYDEFLPEWNALLDYLTDEGQL